jgi:glycosyltransferase involved in cell wall biosynthesis
MRILTLCNCEPDPNLGSGHVIAGFVGALRERGHDVDLYPPHRMQVLPWMHPRAINMRLAWGMKRCARSLAVDEYDVVELWGAPAWRAVDVLRRRPRRRFLIVHHTNGPEPKYFGPQGAARFNPRNRAVDRCARQSFARADAAATVSVDDRDWLVGEGLLPAARVAAIEPGLPAEFCREDYVPRSSRTIGFCATWLPKKGIDVLVRGMPTVLRANPAWRLHLVGVGMGFAAAEHFPADVLGQIEVTPFVADKHALAAMYASWEVFVLPSQFESFGLVLAEAMACGCACVATRVGFSKGLTDGVDVLHMDHAAESIVRCVERLIGDAALRRRLGEQAVARTGELRWDRAAARYEAQLAAWRADVLGMRTAAAVTTIAAADAATPGLREARQPC